MKGFIFSLPPCECILSGERRSGVTAWPLIGRHQPVEKARMMHDVERSPQTSELRAMHRLREIDKACLNFIVM